MRIIAGAARGRLIAAPQGSETIRPTADRVRQSLFNVLGQWFEGLAVLDCYAGTGALALEALSRGASTAVLIDSGKEARALCTRNLDSLGFADRAQFLALPVERGLAQLAKQGRRFGLVFADPPYGARVGNQLLAWFNELDLLEPGAALVLEHAQAEALPPTVGRLQCSDARRYGETAVSIFRLTLGGG
jgi:16S rRNA (guanine966-N2)-methyltransferase